MFERRYDGEIWLDELANRLRFDRLSDWLPYDVPSSYLFVLSFIALDLVGNQGYQWVTGRVPAFVENPLWPLQLVAVFGAVYASRDIHNRYHEAIDWMDVEGRVSKSDPFDQLCPSRAQWVFFGLASGLLLFNALFMITPQTIYAENGIGGIVGVMVVTPIGFAAVGAEFIGSFVAVEILVPRRISTSSLGLYFPDPEKLGGMRPLGELVKHAYYYIMIGLVVFAGIKYAPSLSDQYFQTAYGEPSALVGLIFTVAWIGATLTIAYALFEFHRFMRRTKIEELQRLDEQAREHFTDPWDIHNFSVAESPDSNTDDYEAVRTRIEHVRSTKEYPATFTMWTQLIVSIVLPKAVQLALQAG